MSEEIVLPKLGHVTRFINSEWEGLRHGMPPSTAAFVIGFLLARGESGLQHLKALDTIGRSKKLSATHAEQYLVDHGFVERAPRAASVSTAEKQRRLEAAGWIVRPVKEFGEVREYWWAPKGSSGMSLASAWKQLVGENFSRLHIPRGP